MVPLDYITHISESKRYQRFGETAIKLATYDYKDTMMGKGMGYQVAFDIFNIEFDSFFEVMKDSIESFSDDDVMKSIFQDGFSGNLCVYMDNFHVPKIDFEKQVNKNCSELYDGILEKVQ